MILPFSSQCEARLLSRKLQCVVFAIIPCDRFIMAHGPSRLPLTTQSTTHYRADLQRSYHLQVEDRGIVKRLRILGEDGRLVYRGSPVQGEDL